MLLVDTRNGIVKCTLDTERCKSNTERSKLNTSLRSVFVTSKSLNKSKYKEFAIIRSVLNCV